MYRRVLLAYDGSLEGRVALREGALLARSCGAEVYLLAVTPLISTADAYGASMIQPEAYDTIFKEGLAKAREYGLKVVGDIVHGEPAAEIGAYARKIGADLVVVGHRRKSFLERWWSGPSQATLTDTLECSLLIARNDVSDDAASAAASESERAG
jgi:nucleotide-binding universal stress UspA family protein